MCLKTAHIIASAVKPLDFSMGSEKNGRRQKALTGVTHLAAGLAMATLMPEQTLSVTAAIAIGSVLPDIDKESSIIGRYIPVIPRLLKHRGFTHYPLLAFAVGFFNLPLAIGMWSHLMLDALNPDGLPILGPFFRKKISIPLFSLLFPSGGFIDKLLAFFLWAFVLYRYAALVFGL